MKKFSTILAMFVAALCAAFICGCKSAQYETSDNPQVFVGTVKYTGPVFSPFSKHEQYKYAFYDMNNSFVAYVSFKKVLISSTEQFINKPVYINGTFAKDENGDMLITVDNIKLTR